MRNFLRMNELELAKFMARVRPDLETGCHIWTGGVHPQGHGIVSISRVIYGTAARVIYEHENGRLPLKHSVVRTCENKLCVNLAHLKAVTLKEFAAMRAAKGLKLIGEKVGSAKLNSLQVREIRRLRVEGQSLGSLAKRFKVHRAQIKNVVDRKCWAHVEG